MGGIATRGAVVLLLCMAIWGTGVSKIALLQPTNVVMSVAHDVHIDLRSSGLPSGGRGHGRNQGSSDKMRILELHSAVSPNLNLNFSKLPTFWHRAAARLRGSGQKARTETERLATAAGTSVRRGCERASERCRGKVAGYVVQ